MWRKTLSVTTALVRGKGLRTRPQLTTTQVHAKMGSDNTPSESTAQHDQIQYQAPEEAATIEARPKLFDPQKRPSAKLDESIKGKLLRGEIVARGPKSAGRTRCITPPEKITKIVSGIVQDTNSPARNKVKEYLAAGVKLRRHLHQRQPPQEANVFHERVNETMKGLAPKYMGGIADDALSATEFKNMEDEMRKEAEELVKKRTHEWRPVVYDEDASYAYLLAKTPFDYASTMSVMAEIKRREPDFQPRTLFDYGSGVGSAIWAARDTFGHFTEIFAVDTSGDMNNLARKILLEGKSSHSLPAGIFFRMYLPASNDLTYDLVTCAHTLLDLPSAEARLTAIDKLWRKTQCYLILIEDGSNAGFQVLSEARDYLLQLSSLRLDIKTPPEEIQGSLFAPCPHSGPCPRYFDDVIPCNFDVRFKPFQLPTIPQEIRDLAETRRFSYLIFKKGPDPSESASFPRLVTSPVFKTKKAFCRMCTNRGKLEEYLASKNGMAEDSKLIYQYVRSLKCGDQFQVTLSDEKVPTWWDRKREELKVKNDPQKSTPSHKEDD